MATSITIRPIHSTDEAQWRILWTNYCHFYNEDVPESVTAGLWKRLHHDLDTLYGIVALDSTGAIIGFTHYVLHPHTWSDRPLCYLEDLFVSSDTRGQGVGSALIDHLIALGRERNWKRVYWHTDTGNATARRVYDRFTSIDDCVRYTVVLD